METQSESRQVEGLVAFAAANGVTHPTIPRRGTNGQHIALIPEAHRQHAPLIEERTAHIADALATILVEQARGMVYAVGIQADFGYLGQVTLTLATNYGVSIPTPAYLTDVWDTLRSLSREYRKRQKKEREDSQRYADVTPEKSWEERCSSSSYIKLMRLVYGRCLPKFRRRLTKRYPIASKYREELVRRVLDQEAEADEPYELLDSAIELLLNIRDRREIQIGDQSFVNEISQACSLVRKLAKYQERVQEILGEDFESVWRYLQKGTALQGAVMDLERFARSRRMSPILKKTLKVVCLPEGKPANKLPVTFEDWCSLVKEAQNSFDEPAEESEGFNDAIKKTQKSYCGKRSTLHCEMKVLQHFVSELDDDEIRPISYIGVSKLACMGCWMVMNAWNNDSTDRPKYVLRGSHGKWYFPWAVPALAPPEDPKMREICQVVAKTALEGAREEGIIRLKSDSSVPSGEEELGSDEAEKFHSRFSAKVAKLRLARE